MNNAIELLEAHLLGETDWIHIEELCSLCDLDLDVMVELVELGVVSARGIAPDQWQLPATALPRLRRVGRLIHDLGVNVSGAVLVLQLLDERRELERQVRELERLVHREP